MKRFWLSWYNVLPLSSFELHSPWWLSGYRDDDETICAAIIATDEDAAKAIILKSYDNPAESVEWRFCEEKPADFSPFNDRFPERRLDAVAMIGWLLDWWAARQRQIDIDILWRVACTEARDEDMARMVFMVHCSMDWAWKRLGDDEQIAARVADLPYTRVKEDPAMTFAEKNRLLRSLATIENRLLDGNLRTALFTLRHLRGDIMTGSLPRRYVKQVDKTAPASGSVARQ